MLFLENNYASIIAVDLIQQKKLDFQNFYKSNLMEARFNSLSFYWNNDGMYGYVSTSSDTY